MIIQRKECEKSCHITSFQIFRQEMSPLFQKGYDHVTNIPTYASAKTTLNRIKKRTLSNRLDPNLKEEIIIPDDISQFGQWLENEIMFKNIWNCYQKRHRTNNVVEGWNSRLKKQINRPRPTFLALYKCLKLEAELGDLLFNRHFFKFRRKEKENMLRGTRH
ncbi:hypothetical protein QTP88_002693 [Uroleucon formosanum]